jgi:hypothetical protein
MNQRSGLKPRSCRFSGKSLSLRPGFAYRRGFRITAVRTYCSQHRHALRHLFSRYRCGYYQLARAIYYFLETDHVRTWGRV